MQIFYITIKEARTHMLLTMHCQEFFNNAIIGQGSVPCLAPCLAAPVSQTSNVCIDNVTMP